MQGKRRAYVADVFFKLSLCIFRFKDVVAVPDELYENPSASALRIPANIRQVYVVNGKTAPLFLTVNPVFG